MAQMLNMTLLIGAFLILIGVSLLIEVVRETTILYPLEGHRLEEGEPNVILPFHPRVTDQYEVRLWGHYPNAPLADVHARINADNSPNQKHPERWIDLSWEILRGEEIVARGAIADIHGSSVGNHLVSPLWYSFLLQGDVDYVLRVRSPKNDTAFFEAQPEISVTIGEEFWQDSGYGGVWLVRQFSSWVRARA